MLSCSVRLETEKYWTSRGARFFFVSPAEIFLYTVVVDRYVPSAL